MAITMETDDPEERIKIERIKQAIKIQLSQFDEYSRKIAQAKEALAMDPSLKTKLDSEIDALIANGTKLQDELAREERTTYNILTENPNDIKRLEKQHAKITKIKAAIAEGERKTASLATQVEEFVKKQELGSTLSTLQEGYKKCLDSLMNLRSRYTTAYDEAEQEAGIYFLTTPKK
ncbi:MAG: hypothetical protein Q6373_026260 [Candidatus Sigynarchaeota archaeon]